MKWDIKIMIVFLLLILIYGSSYLFSHGSFAFPVNYVDFGIGLIALVFFVSTKFSWYNFFLLIMGISLLHLPFGYTVMVKNTVSVFTVLKAIGILGFMLFIVIRAFLNKEPSFRALYLFFGALTIVKVIFYQFHVDEHEFELVDLLKPLLGILLSGLIIKNNEENQELPVAIKRMFILLFLYNTRVALFFLI